MNMPLSSILQFKNGKKRPSEEGPYPVYGGNGILGYADQSNYANCIAIGRVGAYCGSVYYEKKPCWISDNAIAALPKDGTNLKYAYHLLRLLNLNERHIGTSQPLLTQEILNKISTNILPPEKQEQVGLFLGRFDEAISLSEQINENIEQQLQVLFKQWLSDHMASATEVTLGEVCSKVTDGSHFSPKDDPSSNIPMFSVKDMERFDFDFSSCKHISEDDYQTMLANDCVPQVNDILVAKDGSYLKEIFICNSFRKIAILSSIAIFRPNPTIILPEVLLALLKSPRVLQEVRDNYVSGSALPRIVLKDFKKLRFYLPSLESQREFASIAASYRSQIANSIAEMNRLKELRDTLLPRFMSGEIDAPNITI